MCMCMYVFVYTHISTSTEEQAHKFQASELNTEVLRYRIAEQDPGKARVLNVARARAARVCGMVW